MKKIIIDDEKSAVEYIKSVLNEWDSWKTHHIYLVQALEELLFVNESRKEELLLMREHLNHMIADTKARAVRRMQDELHKEATAKIVGVELRLPIAHSLVDRIAEKVSREIE